VEALAYIVERISRSGIAPSYGEIGRAMRPAVHRSRAAQFVEQLVREGYLERSPASRRGIAIRDVVRCRLTIEHALGLLGYKHAAPLGDLMQAPSTFGQLPSIPPFEYIPDVD
jgi:SOS-response transcriptional repressor LexA